jgi:photosynthetic reaction center cytochrome c subunit
MKLWLKRTGLAAAAITGGWLIGNTFSGRAAAQQAPPKETAGTIFKNVKTDALKGLTRADFLSAMGVMADSLGLDCADCHPGAGTDKVDWVFDTPQKITARKMVDMVQGINKTYFNGIQQVTCYACHHARDRPSTTVSLDNLYSSPAQDKDDDIIADKAQPAATEILDRYIAALGGAQKLNSLTSFIATGKSIGYEGLGGSGKFTIYAKAPNQRTTEISFPDHPDRAPSVWTWNGKSGWVTTPRGLFDQYQLEGNNADGAMLEAQLSFPGQIKTLLTGWRTGSMESIGENDYIVVEGNGQRGLRAKFYFDAKTNLLSRVIRFVNSPIGRIPIQVEYTDYRDVNGIKFPFGLAFLWLDGRYNAEISDVKINVAIDAKKFEKP